MVDPGECFSCPSPGSPGHWVMSWWESSEQEATVVIGAQLSRPEKGWGDDAEGRGHVLPALHPGSTGEGLCVGKRGANLVAGHGVAGSGPQGWGPRGALGLILPSTEAQGLGSDGRWLWRAVPTEFDSTGLMVSLSFPSAKWDWWPGVLTGSFGKVVLTE